MKDLLDILRELANDGKMASSIVDWSCDLYDRLSDKEESIKVRELELLFCLKQNKEEGLYLLSRYLVS
jgi:hypothetical protein